MPQSQQAVVGNFLVRSAGHHSFEHAPDTRGHVALVSKAIEVPLEQHEFDALVSFDFNTGGIFRAQLTRLVNEGQKEAAANAFMGWSKPRAVIPRRRKEMELFRTGQYSDGSALVYSATESGSVVWSEGKRVNALEVLQDNLPGPSEDAVSNTPSSPGGMPPLFSKFLNMVRMFLRR